ncbi:DUF3135 domain-containing protein [Shewanella sp.]|nr:DUF3135 domain-containing protein [Shewanella sp.]
MAELPNFDKLLWLAKHRPEQLNSLQKQLNDEFIQQSNHSAALNALRSDLDKKLLRCNTVEQRCHAISLLMHQKLSTLDNLLNQPNAFYGKQAKILPFTTQTPHKPVR